MISQVKGTRHWSAKLSIRGDAKRELYARMRISNATISCISWKPPPYLPPIFAAEKPYRSELTVQVEVRSGRVVGIKCVVRL